MVHNVEQFNKLDKKCVEKMRMLRGWVDTMIRDRIIIDASIII